MKKQQLIKEIEEYNIRVLNQDLTEEQLEEILNVLKSVEEIDENNNHIQTKEQFLNLLLLIELEEEGIIEQI